jgi:hypothetical protein
MANAPPPTNAEEGIALVRDSLDQVEDEHSGVPKADPPPPPGQSDGRMYPPRDDFTTRNPDGSISARTRGHDIEVSPQGDITIINRKTGVAEFQKAGAGQPPRDVGATGSD